MYSMFQSGIDSPLFNMSRVISTKPGQSVPNTYYNPHKHVRQLTPPFHVVGQVPEDGPLFHNFFQEVVDFSSDDSEDDVDVEHWPPGLQFLDGDFLLGPLPHNTAAIAG